MESQNPYDEFPNLLYRLHSLPRDERTQRLEWELREALAAFDGLLQELQQNMKRFNQTANDIRDLHQEDEQ